MDKILELARKAGMGGDAFGWLASNHAIQKFYTLARADYETKLSAVMPADFKDWHENNHNEWPEIAAWVITNLREQRADLEADLAATRDLAEGYAQERNELKAENAKLQKANKMLDTALCRAYPYGCYNGDVAYLWNAARASLGDK